MRANAGMLEEHVCMERRKEMRERREASGGAERDEQVKRSHTFQGFEGQAKEKTHSSKGKYSKFSRIKWSLNA